MTADLAAADWAIIVAYLVFAFVIGLWVAGKASTSLRSYFQADGALPWWWCGTSIAATSFAADTPLAVTGIVAGQGLGGNWFWLSWAALHVAVVCFFADRWHRADVVTDAELVSLRYDGRWAARLRVFKALIYGVVINAIILGWVVRAMASIVAPYFHWTSWAPGLTHAVASFVPAGTALSDPSQLITIALLTGLVGLYSTMGGLRGVVLTDLVQFALAMAGAIALAVVAVGAAGGLDGVRDGVTAAHGADVLSLRPTVADGLGGVPGIAAALTALYLFVQSASNNPADGGGFMMQRLVSSRSPRDARRSAGLFVVWNYLVRPWPWFLVALAALVLIPVGHEATVFGGQVASVAGNREQAYPALIAVLLPAGLKGVLIASLLAAFMSTIDTHVNWGSSYLANDVYRAMRPGADERELMTVSRLGTVLLSVVAIISAMYIGSIEGAWKALASVGAGLAAPTALRWLWWRINAAAELAAIAAGLACWAVLTFAVPGLAHSVQLLITAGASTVVCVGVALATRPTDAAHLAAFTGKVLPLGAWPGARAGLRRRAFALRTVAFVALLAATYTMLFAGGELLLGSRPGGVAMAIYAVAAGLGGWAVLRRAVALDAELAELARGTT
ncbi:MAG: Na+:solute symporter [Kofleriaceae bacterium]|nr:Na+:solute symporter [Kofleriaceae bacterium]